jgi:BirA family biotin operon repressor/biotin-[acetyl-CoA-carboxylase] ligase
MNDFLQRILSWEQEFLKNSSCKFCAAECYESVSSTMEEARSMLGRTQKTDGLVIARTQTRGRGRRGNEWQSEHDGFYATFFFTTANEAADFEGLSLVVGSVLVSVCKDWDIKTYLKWPNDLCTAEGKKLAGILIELVPIAGKKLAVLIGIGINLGPVPPSVPDAGSLFEQNRKILSQAAVAANIYPKLASNFRAFENKGFLPFRPGWLEHAIWLGEELQGISNGREVSGVFTGVDEKGRLLLDKQGETFSLSSGDVSLVRRKE